MAAPAGEALAARSQAAIWASNRDWSRYDSCGAQLGDQKPALGARAVRAASQASEERFPFAYHQDVMLDDVLAGR